jgi:hypothetical protein
MAKGQGLDLTVRSTEPGYFSAIQIPLLKGRIFTSDEHLDRAHVAVLNQAAVNLCFPGEDPIGKHVNATALGKTFEIVGVVGDTRWSISEPVRPAIYGPIYGSGYSGATVVERSTRDVETLAIPVQKLIG